MTIGVCSASMSRRVCLMERPYVEMTCGISYKCAVGQKIEKRSLPTLWPLLLLSQTFKIGLEEVGGRPSKGVTNKFHTEAAREVDDGPLAAFCGVSFMSAF